MPLFFSRFQNSALTILAALLLSACSVGLALEGQNESDVSVVKKDTRRVDIEAQLGAPIRFSTDCNGQVTAVYEYELGKEPDPERALYNGVLDLLTFGIWEVVGTPLEVARGDKVQLLRSVSSTVSV